MGKRLKKSRYISGFDGIRTLAVIGVILYHLAPYQFQGGFLGVPIFFVVSGYLITDLLFQEWQQNKRIDVIGFYIRRVKRLYPALVTLVLATTAYITLFARDLLANIRAVIMTNLLYVYNWYQVTHHESYFDKFGTQSPFTHLWSLSIEGQFYLFWPLIIIILLKFVKKKQPIFDTMIILAFISALLMAILYRTGQDPSRVYYGTDTRMFSILLGAALAVVWPSTALRKDLPTNLRLLLDVIGGGALMLLCLMFMQMTGESALVYRGGMFFFSVLSMILVAVVAHPGADMNRLLTNRLFAWIGKRSYGIYLYQYPVLVFFESKINVADHSFLYALIEVALILVLSDLSYRFLELPLQHFDYSKTWSTLKEFCRRDSSYGNKRWYMLIPGLIVLLAVVGATTGTTSGSEAKKDTALEKTIKENDKKVAKQNKNIAAKTSSSEHSSSSADTNTAKQFDLTENEIAKAKQLQITAVGDSVLAASSTTLQEIFPNMYVDAKVGRQVGEAIPVLQSLAQSGKLADTVLLSEGTNGPYSEQELDQIMAIVGKERKLYWINVHVPTRRWQDQVNNDLKVAAKKYPNLKVIDWYTYSKDHPEWFYDDNVHPNPEGLKYYGPYVARQILK
ncbi:acyltransferase family protein [Ligilactobacillus faecis]|uniref:acyltransferase family protein n=1 Tax=Ligilactobacillus faecis TaxID=762833 RepID=UPI00246824F4|nr:acyltransferase family protein [Ligilactobacillus faecis]WGN89273.1 acyltransferase family protein [Ligilactobacillus faecis]